MTGPQKHVLLWIAPEFLQSKGMIRILEQVGAIGLKTGDADEIAEAATRSGGFAISGTLIDANHGAGIWISPGDSESLQLMIPWGFIRCTVMAETPKAAKIFGLDADLVERHPGSPPESPAL